VLTVKVWDFETVDSADITGDMECFEMEPMNELKVGPDVQLRCIVKSCDHDEASIWYAQVNARNFDLSRICCTASCTLRLVVDLLISCQCWCPFCDVFRPSLQ